MADRAVAAGRITINGLPAPIGATAAITDTVTLDGHAITPPVNTITVMYHKPVGAVVSRDGQGSLTIYDLLPEEYRLLKPVGRLDKNSSGLLILTNDGQLAQQLTHPRYAKIKIYEVKLGKALAPLHQQMINDHGIMLEDGNSRLQLERLNEHDDTSWRIVMQEGRNRQIRRTFAALNYHVTGLHRTHFGPYALAGLAVRQTKLIEDPKISN